MFVRKSDETMAAASYEAERGAEDEMTHILVRSTRALDSPWIPIQTLLVRCMHPAPTIEKWEKKKRYIGLACSLDPRNP